MRKPVAILLALSAPLAAAQSTAEQRLLDEIAAALGGRERILAARTLSLDGTGTHYNLGQDMRPGASGQTFTVTQFARKIDLTGGRSRTELTRTPNFAYFRGQAPQQVAEDASAPAADFFHYPLTLVQAALKGATLANLRTSGEERSVEVRIQKGPVLVLTVDRTGLPTRIASRSHHPNLGDVVDSTAMADYQVVDGIRLPTRLTRKVDAFTTADLRVGRQTRDGDLGALPASPPAAATALMNVVAESLAPGVWLLAGQSHHSALIEFRDHLTLIDAPQSEARTLAVIAKAKELRPGKPLTEIVTTHHHFDHTAGIRAAMAEGMTVITHEGNREFFTEIAKRPFTISPDALAKSPRSVKVDPFASERTITDGAMTVALYHIAGNPHSDTMLMAYLPKERLLIEVDAFSPGASVNPYAANLLEQIRKRKLQVDRIVPLHGAVAAFSELEKVGGK